MYSMIEGKEGLAKKESDEKYCRDEDMHLLNNCGFNLFQN